jgi:hypothetical protein
LSTALTCCEACLACRFADLGQFLDSKAPCLPLLSDASSRELIGVVTKSHVIEALAEKSGDYLEALELPIKVHSSGKEGGMRERLSTFSL